MPSPAPLPLRQPPHPATLDESALLDACRVRRGRASGPGGQHRNKVETAIHLTHTPTAVNAAATERRSQIANQRTALFRLRLNLAIQVRCRWQTGKPSDRWQARRRDKQLPVNPAHTDFPALLAEALDVVHACDADVRRAAEALGISTSQLVKLVGKYPPALARLNDDRRQRGLRTLR